MSKLKDFLRKNGKAKNIALGLLSRVSTLSIKKRVSGKNNKIRYKNTIFKNTTFDIVGNNNSITIMEGCRLTNLKFYIRGNDNSIILHEKVRYNGTLWTQCNRSSIEIGANTTTESKVGIQISEDDRRIDVGNDCMFSSNISVWAQDWHKIYDENQQLINKGKNVVIKNHVWIGYDAKILKGVTIGNNNIIGTDTIVTKSFEEENVVIAGNPGKIVKRSINWER